MPANSTLRRNRTAFFLDYVFFGVGLAFAGTSTTLPAFVAKLTGDPVLIGMVGALWNGGWLLPQILAAHYLSGVKHKMRVARWGSWAGRPVFLLLAGFLVLTHAHQAGLTLGLLFLSILIFAVTDAIVTVAWFDVLAKAIPARSRGRLMGWGQVGSGVLSIGAGLAVGFLLGPGGPSFPDNYAVVFLLATIAFLLSLATYYFIHEPIEAVTEERAALAEYLPKIARFLERDRPFLQVNLARLLIGLSAMSTPFYVVYATQRRGLPDAAIGAFATAATVGGAVAGLALGPVADRFGSHRVVQVMAGLQMLVPLLAIGTALIPFSELFLLVLFTLVFLLQGIADGSLMLGIANFVLEIAPASERSAYIGLANTLAGVLILYPLAGGWIAAHSGYPTVFAISAGSIALGGLVASRLPNPRRARFELPMRPPEV